MTGVRLLRVEPTTGELLSETPIYHRDPETGAQPKWEQSEELMPGVLKDLLSSDGQFVYLQSLVFDAEGVELDRKKHGNARFVAPAGLLDDSMWMRCHWVFAKWYNNNWSGARTSTTNRNEYPSGTLLVADETTVYGYGKNWHNTSHPRNVPFHPTVNRLFAANKQPLTDEKATEEAKRMDREIYQRVAPRTSKQWARQRQRQQPKQFWVDYHWSRADTPQIWAMCVAGKKLAVAGPVGVVTQADDSGIESSEGSVLRVLNKKDGTVTSEINLPAAPVWEGMAAAGGKLHLAMKDGTMACYE